MTYADIVTMVLAAGGGAGLGLVYLVLLRATVRHLLVAASAWRGGLFSLARLAAVATGLWIAAQFGALSLLAAAGGFTVVRLVGTRFAPQVTRP